MACFQSVFLTLMIQGKLIFSRSYCINQWIIRNLQGTIVKKKIRNNLLAAVLILTVIPATVKIGQTVIEPCYLAISQKLVEMDEVSYILWYWDANIMIFHLDIFDCSSLC